MPLKTELRLDRIKNRSSNFLLPRVDLVNRRRAGEFLAITLCSLIFLLVPLSVSGTPRLSDQFPENFGNPSVYPRPNSHIAPPTTVVSVTYEGCIDPSTVSTRTFAVHATQSSLLAQSYQVHSNTIVFASPQTYRPGELIQVSATTGTLGLSGATPISSTVWQFWTSVLGGSGEFVDSGQTWGRSFQVSLGDLDADGDLDAFMAELRTPTGRPNMVWMNDGEGSFVDSGQQLGMTNSTDVALGDLDGDSDLDAFVTNWFQPDRVWLNDGTGIFFDSGEQLGASGETGVVLADLDGDGDLDALVARLGGSKVWLNKGDGGFHSSQRLGRAHTRHLTVGDLDGDGDLDAVLANDVGYRNEVWLNTGAGEFSLSDQVLDGGPTWDVALGDVDSDGDMDALFARRGAGNTLWLNEGDGLLIDSGQRLGTPDSFRVELGDIDGDHDLDAFFANYGHANTVWPNDGAGNFSESHQRLGSYNSTGTAFGDVNGDGDLDVFVGNGGHGNRIWLNRGQWWPSHSCYLPLVNNAYVRAPDLVIEEITAEDDTVQLTINNQGDAPVTTEFWVDVYIDPDPPPASVNEVWYDGRCSEGLVWGVTASALPLQPGVTLTLTVGDEYYSALYSHFTGAFPQGTPIYAQVDSANLNSADGGVLEIHEINGEAYNNIIGPILSTLVNDQ